MSNTAGYGETRWLYCPKCGKGLASDWQHCPFCGLVIGGLRFTVVNPNYPNWPYPWSPPYPNWTYWGGNTGNWSLTSTPLEQTT